MAEADQKAGGAERREGEIAPLWQKYFGVLDAGFLSQSISAINLPEPRCVPLDASLDQVMCLLKQIKAGCVVVLSESGSVAGIFSERDYVIKVYGSGIDPARVPVSQVMTADPVTQPPDAAIVHVLNLMSTGGFRHIPVVDQENEPLWMVSVKDIVDHIVGKLTEDLLQFDCVEKR